VKSRVAVAAIVLPEHRRRPLRRDVQGLVAGEHVPPRGRIVTRTATGSLTGTRRYNENDELDPNGTVVCRTGTVRYSIKKRLARRR
jgi:hypothetical protein